MNAIEVCINPALVPPYLAAYPDFWIGQRLREAGVPLFERSIAEGVHRGTLQETLLEGGSRLFRWTPPEVA